MEIKDVTEQMLKTCCNRYPAPFCPPNGICRKLNIKSHIPYGTYCPICLSKNCYCIEFTPKDENGKNDWSKQKVVCIDCKWQGLYVDVEHIKDEEYLKITRKRKLNKLKN
jgi:hypothetical protein